MCPQDLDEGSYFARGGHRFHEWAETHGQVEDRANLPSAARTGHPVEYAVRPLRRSAGEPAIRAVNLGTKAVKRRKRTLWGNLEHCAASAGGPCERGCSVKIAVAALNRPERAGTISAVEAVQCDRDTCGGDFENCARAAADTC